MDDGVEDRSGIFYLYERMTAYTRIPTGSIQNDFVRVEHVGKFYASNNGPVEILRGIRFDVASRQFVSILGASGCGKSTLLMMLAGLEATSSGNIVVGGQPVRTPRRDVGVIFQDPTLLPWKSALENVLLPIEIFREPVVHYRDRAETLLRMVGLGAAMHLRPAQLSGGMRQRVAICRALIHDPVVLLMDEPFSSLDAITRDDLNIALLEIWQRQQQTAFFVTHSIREAVFLSDRVIILGGKPGQVIADVNVPLARPRDPAIGDAVEFNSTCAALRAHLAVGHRSNDDSDSTRFAK